MRWLTKSGRQVGFTATHFQPRRSLSLLLVSSSTAWRTAAEYIMVTSCARNNLGARLRSTWCTRNDADGGSISPEHWKVLYRAFLLRVHPDFFHDLPEERSVNEKNLQALSMHLGERDHTAIPRSGRLHGSMDSGGARLVFFLKATTTESSAIATVTDATALATDATSPATCAATPATDATAPATDATAADAAPAQAFEYDGGDDDDDHHGSNRVNRRRNGAVDHDSRISSNINGDITATTSPDYCSNGAGYGALLAPPKKVMLPLQSHRTSTKLELMHLLRAAGVTLPPEISMTPPPPARPPHRSHLHEQESTTATTPFGWDEEDNWAGMDDLFGGTWSGSRSSSRFYGASDPYQNRRYDGESAQERRRAEGGGPSATAGLGFVLETEAGRTLVRERRRSTRNVRRLVEELREQYGFGEFSFRCGWSKSNLCVALESLLNACATHRQAFSVPNFGGLGIVFRNDPSFLNNGEIRLSPADVPLEWVSVLQGVTVEYLSVVEDQARELGHLEAEASAILRGASVSRGLSCSKSRYREFLSGLWAAEAPQYARGEVEEGAELAQGDWSQIRCKVEEGFGRVSTVLEDGTIQIGTDMALATVWRCLDRDFAHSSAVSTESQRLAEAASRAAKRCREHLGLESIDRAAGVTLAQMVVACEALASALCPDTGGGGGGGAGGAVGAAAAATVRRRLRGHCVVIVGERHGDVDGVTENGEIAIRWDYWEVGAGGGGWGGNASGSGIDESPFSFSAS